MTDVGCANNKIMIIQHCTTTKIFCFLHKNSQLLLIKDPEKQIWPQNNFISSSFWDKLFVLYAAKHGSHSTNISTKLIVYKNIWSLQKFL